jgi:hypothetical protein
MSYIAKLIEQECPECQGQRVATILMRNGITNFIKEHHFEVFTYFQSRLDFYKEEYSPLRMASKDTMKKFKISRYKLFRIRKEF